MTHRIAARHTWTERDYRIAKQMKDDGYSYPTIAERIGVHVKTVYSKLRVIREAAAKATERTE